MSTAHTATTLVARNKFALAHAGIEALPPITQIAFGDGGHDGVGDPIDPDPTATEVPGEFIRKAIDAISVTDHVVEVEGCLDYDEGVGETVSACGIYDDNDDLVAIKTFTPKSKDGDTRIEIDWNENF